MKTRHGFVSNSSSSSFVVAVRKKLKGQVKLVIEVDLSSYAKNVIMTILDLENYFKNNSCFKDNQIDYHDDPIYVDAKKAIENGQDVFMESFSDEGSSMESFLCDYGIANAVDENDNKVLVIQGKGGY